MCWRLVDNTQRSTSWYISVIKLNNRQQTIVSRKIYKFQLYIVITKHNQFQSIDSIFFLVPLTPNEMTINTVHFKNIQFAQLNAMTFLFRVRILNFLEYFWFSRLQITQRSKLVEKKNFLSLDFIDSKLVKMLMTLWFIDISDRALFSLAINYFNSVYV